MNGPNREGSPSRLRSLIENLQARCRAEPKVRAHLTRVKDIYIAFEAALEYRSRVSQTTGSPVVLRPSEILGPFSAMDELVEEALSSTADPRSHEMMVQFRRALEEVIDDTEERRASALPTEQRLDIEATLPYLSEALKVARAEDKRDEEAAILYQMGWLFDELRRPVSALRQHRAALAACAALRDHRGCAANLHMMGVACRHLERYDRAVEHLGESLEISGNFGERNAIAMTQAELALIHEARGEYLAAERLLAEALDVFRDIGEPENLAHCEVSLRRVRARLPGPDAVSETRSPTRPDDRVSQPSGLAAHNETAVPGEETPREDIRFLGELFTGLELSRTGRSEEALRLFLEAAERHREVGDTQHALAFTSQAGQLLNLMGRSGDAAALLEQAAKDGRRIGDGILLSEILSALGEVYRVQGRYEEALPILGEAIELAKGPGDELARCIAAVRLGETQKAVGRTSEALATLRGAAEDASNIEPSTWTQQSRCDAFTDLGSLLRLMGRHRESLKWLKRARDEALSIENPLTTTNALRELGLTLLESGQPLSALHSLAEAAAASETIEAPLSKLSLFVALAATHRRLELPEEALVALEKARRESLRTGENTMRWRIELELAAAQVELGRFADAERSLAAALQEATLPKETLTLCQVHRLKAHLDAVREDWDGVRNHAREAEEALLTALSHNRWPEAIGTVLSSLMDIFDLGVLSCERRWRTHPDPSLLLEGLEFLDAAKCAAIREAMRRHGTYRATAMDPEPWQPGPEDWKRLFMPPGETAGDRLDRPDVSRLRERQPADGDPDVFDWMLEFLEDCGGAERQFCTPIRKEDYADLLGDGLTVLMNFFLIGDDLIVLPLCSTGAGRRRLRLCHLDTGYFRIVGGRRVVEAASEEWDQTLAKSEGRDAQPALRRLCEHLYSDLRIEDLLYLVEPDIDKRRRLHLILVPDGPLYRLPIHAFRDGDRNEHFYEKVASIRYSLSMRSLQLQDSYDRQLREEEARKPGLRGVGFAWPDRSKSFLPGVIAETSALVVETGADCWSLFGENPEYGRVSTRAAFRQEHRKGNLGWIMTHGSPRAIDEFLAPGGYEARVLEPALLLADGFVSMSRLVVEGFNFLGWRLLYISACLLGRIEHLGESREARGYIATLTTLGCRRIVSPQWVLDDRGAAVFARYYVRALKKRAFGDSPAEPQAFALAFREAIDAFRASNHGQFDQEFFWAPYTLYGLA